MKQKFFTNTIQSNLIKNLIYNTPIPIINTVNTKSYLFKDNVYINNGNIIRCTKSGPLKMPELKDGDTFYYRSGDIQILNEDNISNITRIGDTLTGDTSTTPRTCRITLQDSPEIINKLIVKITDVGNDNIYNLTIYNLIQSTDDEDNSQHVVINSNPTVVSFVLRGNLLRILLAGMSTNVKAEVTPIYGTNTDVVEIDGDYFPTISSVIYDNIRENYTPIQSICGTEKVEDFHFGMYYPKLTELYHSNERYYDSKTHERLGQLLRCYRDIYGINLMPYYNCISNDYISDLKVYEDKVVEESTSEYKTYRVPVKFNTTYTLALDCLGEVHIAPVLLNGDYLISNINYISGNSFNPNNLLKDNITIFNSLSFNRPVTIDVCTTNIEEGYILQQYEKYLYLLIQMPRNVDSSIVLLEGDYTKYGVNNVYNVEDIDSLSDLDLSDIMNSKLSLLQMNDKVTYPYANRLIEYLLLNVITSQEPIAKNVERIQNVFNPINEKSVRDVWDNKLRSDVYLNYQNVDFARQLDLNGFVDKDTEALINKLN